MERHLDIDLSQYRYVFACGDIHGNYEELERALDAVGFDSRYDRLVSVGDLVDRGPQSHRAFEFVTRPYVLRVLGNHDVLPHFILTRRATRQDANLWGAQWLSHEPEAVLRQYDSVLRNAPYTMTVTTPKGYRVGFVHADCARIWSRHIDGVRRCDPVFEDMSLMSRETIYRLLDGEGNVVTYDIDEVTVVGIDHVFHGHTPRPEPLTAGNRTWLDTGSGYPGGRLTLVNVDDWVTRWREC